MPALVRHDVGVFAGAVKVGEDERRAIGLKLRAVAARELAVPHGHIVQAVVHQKVDVGLRLRGQFAVHAPGHAKAELLIPQWHGIALRKEDPAVVGVQVLKPQPLPAALAERRRHGHQLRLHLLPEAPHILRRVADAVHAQVAQLHKARKAQSLCLPVAVFHQAVVDVLQLCALLLPGIDGGLIRPAPDHPVQGLLVPGQAAAADPDAAVVRLRVGHQLVVAAQQRVFLLLKRDQAAVVAHEPRADEGEREGPHQPLEAVRKGRLHQQLAEAVPQRRDFRPDVVVIGLLPRIERVVHVHAVADIAQVNGGHGVAEPVLPLQNPQAVILAGDSLHIPEERPVFRLDLLIGDPPVGHVAKVHHRSPLCSESGGPSASAAPELQLPGFTDAILTS